MLARGMNCGASRRPPVCLAFPHPLRSMASSTSPSRLVGDSMRRAFKTGSTKFGGPQRRYRRAARCWFSSFAKPERHSGATLMKSDSENGTGAPAPLVSRRKFMLAAAATGGAGLLSAVTGGAGLLPAGLVPMNAHGSADKAAPFVLPKATEDGTPFKVSVPQSAIDDLKRRLASTRWPERETVGDWSQGVPLQKAHALVAYWRDKYDWRRFEARINAFPQYRTQIDGVGIHFIHVRSPQQNALPIILTHGWPGSVVEFMEVIGPLSDPTRYGGMAEDGFHVVVPSLPGFGFSDKPVETGSDANRGRVPRPLAIRLLTRPLARHCGSTRNSRRGPITTEIPKMHSPSMQCSTISVSTGSPTPPRRRPASTGRTPAPEWRACPADGSNCQWRRRFFRTRYSSRQRPGLRRCGPTCSTGMSSTGAGPSPRSDNQSPPPREC